MDMKFFRDLIWPGAAGSIFWAVFTVPIDPNFHGSDVVTRTLVLVCLAFYLSFDWLASDWTVPVDPLRFGGNLAHIVSITIFAIGMATGRSEPWLWWSLLLVFGIAILAHMIGVWDPTNKLPFIRQRVWQALPNFLGPAVLLGLNWSFQEYSIVHLFIAIALVIVAWFMLQWFKIRRPSCFD